MPVAFRISCCLCRKNIPLAQDVFELDAEWQRRFPSMVGVLACARCALSTPWSCEKGGRKAYVEGHIPAARSNCFDAWSHVGLEGTHRAMVVHFPESALLQGAEPYVRWRADDKQTGPEVAARMRAALLEWDGASTGVIR